MWRPGEIIVLVWSLSLTGSKCKGPLSTEQIEQLYVLLDASRDGMVSSREFVKADALVSRSKLQKDNDIPDAFDTNEDRMIDVDEWLDMMRVDKDGDRAEVQRERFNIADKDGDLLLSKNEFLSLFFPQTDNELFVAMVTAEMSKRDMNNDGHISLHEHEQAQQTLLHRVPVLSDDDFNELDINKDAFLSLDEFMDGFSIDSEAHRNFKMIDTDKNGNVTYNEFLEALTDKENYKFQFRAQEIAQHHEL